MKKVYLSFIGFALICRQHAFSQPRADSSITKPFTVATAAPVKQDTTYVPRKLHIDEIDLVSSYYKQDGDHSAITGGIGTQHVTDVANGLTVNLVWLNKGFSKYTLSAGIGIDHHSSASSAYVALNGTADPGGTRIYPSLDWTVENTKTGGAFGIGAYYSGEYNYKSKGADLRWSAKTSDKNGEFTAKLQGYFDEVKLIYPSEFIPVPSISSAPPGSMVVTTASGNTEILSTGGQVISNSKNELASSSRTTFSASLSYTQQINSRLQIAFLGDVVKQSGYLGLPYHRVYFAGGKDTIEKLPSSRFKLPIGFRLNYFLGDNIILRSYYRYYTDDWGIHSNTVGLEVPYKVTPFFSISPFYRFYNQSASKYFAPYEQHSLTDEFFTSNYEYSKFQSSFYGIGIRVAPPGGVLGWHNLHEVELRYGHYTQTTDLVSDVVSINLGFK